MEEKIFVGCGYGQFRNESGNMQDYCNAFVLEDFYGVENSDYHYRGQKAVKYRCVSPDVFKDIPVGVRVRCGFDSKARISFMEVIPNK